MLKAFLAGFLLGGSLIVAIGAQNAFVLRQGLLRQHVLPLVLFCAISDALLIFAGVAGAGALMKQVPGLFLVAGLGATLFLVWYGFVALKRAMRPEAMIMQGEAALSLSAALAQAAAFTWLNPHVYLDTVVLVGSLSATYQNPWWFGTGAAVASFVWFFGLGYGARLLAPLFAKPMAWRVLDYGICAIMWGLAVMMVFTFL
ncbi:MAG: LysE/ArgO family amino acid transporter [Beijerinckiaceae bacterium]